MRIRTRSFIAVVTCGVTLTLSAAADASGAPSEAPRQADEVVLAERTVRHYQGTRTGDGGCRYTGEEVVHPDAVPAGMVVLEREIGHDLTRCTLTVERGFVSPAAVGVQPEREAARVTETASGAAEGLTGGASAAAVTRSAFHKTYYEDPPGIDVTSVQAEVEWTTDGSCVASYWSYHTGEWGWFSPSGWERTSYALNHYKDCGGTTTIVEGKFRNDLFCRALAGPILSLIWGDGATTWTEYTPTVIKGQLDGSYWMQWTAYKSGGCSNLLSFQRTHGYL